jgi:hypothetical protein
MNVEFCVHVALTKTWREMDSTQVRSNSDDGMMHHFLEVLVLPVMG